MKTWALIKDDKVINTVIASDEDIKDPAFLWVDITGTNVGIGWSYDGVKFQMPEGTVSDG